jgi:cellulose synthase operon protein C
MYALKKGPRPTELYKSTNSFIPTLIYSSLISISLLGSVTQAKTVGAIIKNIEKSKVNLPQTRDAAKAAPVTNVNLRLVKPSNTGNPLFQAGSNEGSYEKLLNQQIDQLYSLSKKTRSKSMQGDVWLRLAKAYTEKSALVERRINEDFDKRMEDYFSKKIPSKPTLNMGPAQAYNKKAVELYRWYLRDNPKSANSDQVLFFLGYNTMALGDNTAGVKYYETLSQRYPKSEFVTEANLSLADYYFDQGSKNYAQSQGHYKKAEIYYKKIILSKSRLSSIATYKLAWVNLKLSRPNEALSLISRVIRDGKFKDQRKVSADRLAKEAQRELPMFYAQVQDYKKAIPYFKATLPKQDVSKALEQLALLYADSGQREGAGYLFDYLSKTGDLSAGKVFDFQLKRVQLAETKGGIVNSRMELLDLIEGFGPKTNWAAKARKEQSYDEPYKKMESLVKNYALSVHKESRAKNGELNSLRKADEAYKIYETNFAKEDTTGEMKFFHAELLYEAKQFARSADLYGEIAKIPNSKYSEQAKLNSLLAIEKVLPSIEEIKKKVGQSTEVYPLDDSEKKFMALTQQYLDDPKNKESRVEVTYKMASMLYSHNYLDDAEKYFKIIIQQYPKTQYAEYSTNLILDIYNLRKDYKGLERVGLELIEKDSVKDEKALAEVKSIVEKSAFKSAEDVGKLNQPLDTAKAYLDFYKKYPKSSLGPMALYNSAVNFEKADRKSLAIETYERYRKEANPKDKEYTKTYLFSGILKESIGDLTGAVQDYELYIKSEDPKEIQPSLYFNIAIIYEGLKNFSKVKEYFLIYSSKVNAEESRNIIFRLASYADQLSLINEAITYYKMFIAMPKINKDLQIEAVGRLAMLSRQSGNLAQTNLYFAESVKLQSTIGSKKNAKYAAEAMFLKTDKIYSDLKDAVIGTNPATQQAQVQKKIKLVEDLRKSTEAVIAYDVPEWVVAALTKMGQGYQHLAYALVSAPLPKDLTKEESEEYKSKIAEIANPFKLNAIQSYQNAIDRAESLSGFGPYYEIARAELFNLSPSSTYLASEMFYVILSYDYTLDKNDSVTLLTQEESNFSKLIEVLGRLLEKDSSDKSALEFMANYYFKKSMFHMAKIYLNKLEKISKNPRVFNNLGVIYSNLNMEVEAQKEFEKAINLDPSYILARVNFMAKFIKNDGFSPVLSDLESLYQKTRSQISKVEMAKEIATNYGVALSRSKNFSKAVGVNQEVLMSYPKDLAALRNQSLVLITGQKNKIEGSKVLDQFKSIARNRKDLDTIKELEGYLKTL